MSPEGGKEKLVFSSSVTLGSLSAVVRAWPILHSEEAEKGLRGGPSSSPSLHSVAGQSGDHWRTWK